MLLSIMLCLSIANSKSITIKLEKVRENIIQSILDKRFRVSSIQVASQQSSLGHSNCLYYVKRYEIVSVSRPYIVKESSSRDYPFNKNEESMKLANGLLNS